MSRNSPSARIHRFLVYLAHLEQYKRLGPLIGPKEEHQPNPRWEKQGRKMDNVWQNTVDQGKFDVRVVSDDDPYKGRLVVTEVSSEKILLDVPVGISFGAPFGADIADVNEWQDKAITAIDSYLGEGHA